MQFSHDKHLYFFEKHLRGEMKGEELASFEKKLAENEKFKSDFDYYQSNRNEIVEEELAEYDTPELLKEKPQKWGWVLAIISLLCLVLIIDYYFSASYSGDLSSANSRKPFIEKINIFKHSPKHKESGFGQKDISEIALSELSPPMSAEDTLQYNLQTDADFVQYVEANGTAIQGDYFISDSVYKVLTHAAVLDRTNLLRLQTDSLLDDSSLHLAAVKSFQKTLAQIQGSLLVEYWGSPIHFRGYFFDGKKLLIYGFESNILVFLIFNEQNNSYHILLRNKEFHLFADSQLHQLAEE